MNPFPYWNNGQQQQPFPPYFAGNGVAPYIQMPQQGYYDPAYYNAAAYQQYLAEEEKKKKKLERKKRRKRRNRRKKKRALAERRRMLNGGIAGAAVNNLDDTYGDDDTGSESSGDESSHQNQDGDYNDDSESNDDDNGGDGGEDENYDTPVTIVPSKSSHTKFIADMSNIILNYLYSQTTNIRNVFREANIAKTTPGWSGLIPAEQEAAVAAATPLANKASINWMQGVINGATTQPFGGFMTPQSLATALLPMAQTLPTEFMEALQYASSEHFSTDQELLEIPYNVSVGDNTTEFALSGTAIAQPKRITLEGFVSDVIKDAFCGCSRVDGFSPPVLHYDATTGVCSGDDLLFPTNSNVASSRELFKFTIGKLVASRLHTYAQMYTMRSRDVLARGDPYAMQNFRGSAYQVTHELATMVNQKVGSLRAQLRRVRKTQKKSGSALKNGVEYVAAQVSYGNMLSQQQQQYQTQAASASNSGQSGWNGGASPSFSPATAAQQPPQQPPAQNPPPYYGGQQPQQQQAPPFMQPPYYNPYQLQYATRRPDDVDRHRRKKKHKKSKHRRHNDETSSSSLSTSGYSDDS